MKEMYTDFSNNARITEEKWDYLKIELDELMSKYNKIKVSYEK